MYRGIDLTPRNWKPSSKRRISLIVSFALLYGTGAHGETLLAPVIVSASENKTPLLLDQESSTGSRTGLSVRDIPASVELISSETMRERGDFNIKDGIVRTTGLTEIGTVGNGGMGFSTRGFAATPGTTTVGIADDGLILSPASGTMTYPGDGWGYQRIEVLRGPASVVFGVGTVGATINAIRKTPSRDSSVETLVGLGEHGSARVGLGATGALGEQASFRVDAYGTTTNGFRDMGQADSAKLMTTLRIDPRQDLRLELMADYSRQHPERYYGTPLVNGKIDDSLRGQNYNIADGIISYEDTRLRGRVEWRANHWLSLRDEVFSLQADRHWRNVEVYTLNPANSQVTRSSYTDIFHDETQIGNRLEASLTGRGHKAVVGWELSKVDFRSTTNAPYGGTSVVSVQDINHGNWSSTNQTLPRFDSETIVQALYFEDAYTINERLELLAGVRRDISRVSHHELQPGQTDLQKTLSGTSLRLGLTYRWDLSTRVYIQSSTGYDPVVNLVSLNLANRDFTLPSGRQIETGIKQSFAGGKGEWTAALYRIEKKDILTRAPVNPTITIQGGRQHSQGIEVAIGIAPWQGWRFEGNFTTLQARFDELIEAGGVSRAGNHPTNVPEQVANAWGHYQWSNWQASLGIRYVGKRYGDSANTLVLPAYTVADASLAWYENKTTTLRAFIRNLADTTYATTAYRTSQFMLGDPRRLELVAEFKF